GGVTWAWPRGSPAREARGFWAGGRGLRGAIKASRPRRNFAFAAARQPATEEGHDQARVEFERPVEILQRAIEIAFLHASQATIVVSARVTAVESDGQRIIVNRSLKLALIEPAVATLHIGGGGLRSRPLRLRHCNNPHQEKQKTNTT